MPSKQFGVAYDPATTPLDGTETLSIVQGGVTVDCTISDIVANAGDMTNPMTTAGDLIVGGVSGDPDRLAVGSDGQVLTVVAGEPAWATGGGGGGGSFTLIDTQTVSGAAATSVTFSTLDLATAGRYQIQFSIGNATASAAVISLYYNADTTAGNYRNETFAAFDTALSGARAATGRIAEMGVSTYVTGVIDIMRDLSGRPRAISTTNRDEPASLGLQLFTHIRTNTANVTSITLTSSVANSLSIGSVFKLYSIT